MRLSQVVESDVLLEEVGEEDNHKFELCEAALHTLNELLGIELSALALLEGLVEVLVNAVEELE